MRDDFKLFYHITAAIIRGVPIFPKVGVDKTATVDNGPHHRYTLPPKDAKIVLKSVF